MADRTVLPLIFEAPRRGKPPPHWSDLDPAARRDAVVSAGLPAYRADQISRQWYGRLSDDPSAWTDLPAAQREAVAAAFFPALLESVQDLSADAGMTVKTLWRLHDGARVESVLMRYPRQGADQHLRTTICVSSQAGCGMACPFCATGQGGLQRNMSTGEIVEQVTAAARALARGQVAGGPGRINNVVFMGMGEPLANYSAVVGAVRQLIEPCPQGLGISARGITVSTVGLVPRINQLAAEGIPVTLALSLHAPDDELRDEIVPVNNRWKVAEAVDAAWAYAQATGRRVSIEYALIKDVNDQADRADLLARVLNRRGRGWVHVNLIPLNPTPGSRWTASDVRDEREFVRRLETARIRVTIRDTRGREIDGACGQLAASGSPTRKD
jgi:23S rRNA (adenine2503-C2)-methyltransferase